MNHGGRLLYASGKKEDPSPYIEGRVFLLNYKRRLLNYICIFKLSVSTRYIDHLRYRHHDTYIHVSYTTHQPMKSSDISGIL